MDESTSRKAKDYLLTLPNQNIKQIYYRGKNYTPSELAKEIEEQTPIGMWFTHSWEEDQD